MKKTKNKDPDLFDLMQPQIDSSAESGKDVCEQQTFNLIDEKWIPVANSSERKSLKDIFSDRTLKRLSGNPVDKIAVFRLLLSIAHASTDIPNDDAWLALSDEIISRNALAYLDKWHDRFDLFGEKPFLQFPQLASKGKKDSFSSLQVEVSSGNKVVLTDWNTSAETNLAEKAVLILRSSFMGCGSKKYDNSISLSSGYSKKSTARAGTLLGYAGYLHSYVQADTILLSVYYNMLTDEDISMMGAFPKGKGVPFWENMPRGERDARALEYSKSYQGELIPLDKFLLLNDGKIIKTDGIVYPGHKEGFVDPAVTVSKKGSDIKAEWVRTDKHPWRSLPALLTFLETDKIQSPFFISFGKDKLIRKGVNDMGIWVGGIAVSSNAGEQYVSGTNDYVESDFSFPVAAMSMVSFHKLQTIMSALDEKSRVLYGCISAYFREMNSDASKDMSNKACVKFWESMTALSSEIIELAFPATTMNDDEFNEAFQAEIQKWHTLIQQVYSNHCANETPRQMTAWVNHYPNFSTSNKKTKEKS